MSATLPNRPASPTVRPNPPPMAVRSPIFPTNRANMRCTSAPPKVLARCARSRWAIRRPFSTNRAGHRTARRSSSVISGSICGCSISPTAGRSRSTAIAMIHQRMSSARRGPATAAGLPIPSNCPTTFMRPLSITSKQAGRCRSPTALAMFRPRASIAAANIFISLHRPASAAAPAGWTCRA